MKKSENRSSQIVIIGSLSLGAILAIVGLWRLTQNQPPQSAFSTPVSPTVPSQDRVITSAAAPARTAARSDAGAGDIGAKVTLLEEILASRNDNDPRLDTELRYLDTEAKSTFQKRYADYAPERRNERGTIVFLLGRNLSDSKDFAFLKSVVTEAPCLSLGDCSKAAEAGDPHLESAAEVTLAYPQLVALKQIENFLKNGGTRPELIQEAKKVIEAAKGSRNSKVAELARELEKRL